MEQINGNPTPILNSLAIGDGGIEVIDTDLNITEGGPVVTGTTDGCFSLNGGPTVGVEAAISAMNGNNSSAPGYSTPQYSPTSPAANVEFTPGGTPKSRVTGYKFGKARVTNMLEIVDELVCAICFNIIWDAERVSSQIFLFNLLRLL